MTLIVINVQVVSAPPLLVERAADADPECFLEVFVSTMLGLIYLLVCFCVAPLCHLSLGSSGP